MPTSVNDKPWPPLTDFSGMLQNPQVAFDIAHLKTCQIERDANGQPRARAGAFAAVYKATLSSSRNCCVRIFTSRADERRERYDEVSRYLKQKRLSCLVEFEYIEKGIRHPTGTWYPILTMEWVEGGQLFGWVRDQCQKQDKKSLLRAAESWADVVAELANAQIAHGDLQHLNVMVTPTSQLKLVDYDCMCVPSLLGRPTLEGGVEPYQHPQRGNDTVLFAELDHFSALVIFAALRALAAEPGLWFQHVEPPNGELYDKLLFRKSDFDEPHLSGLYGNLRKSPDHKVRKLADDLIAMWKGKIYDIPRLCHFATDIEAIRKQLENRNYDEALELVDQNPTVVLPQELADRVEKAREAVARRLDLELAVNRGDEAAMIRLYDSTLLDDYPKAVALTSVARHAKAALEALDNLQAAHASGDLRGFVRIWDDHASLLDSRKSAATVKRDVERGRKRNESCDQVLKAWGPPLDANRLAGAWERLEQLGGHPDGESRRREIELAIQRHSAWKVFTAVPNDLSEAADKALVNAWQEALFQGWPDAERERNRLDEANTRLAEIEALRQLIARCRSTVSLTDEQAICAAASKLPRQYQLGSAIQERRSQAEERVRAYSELASALNANPPSEQPIANAWESLKRADGIALANPAESQRAELALRRKPVIQRLGKLSHAWTIDKLDQEILNAWDEDLLRDCADVNNWRNRHADASQRRELLAQLELNLTAQNDDQIVAIASNPLLQAYPFSTQTSSQIEQAKCRAQEAQSILDVLRNGDRERFVTVFDFRIVKQHVSKFDSFQSLIREWSDFDLRPCEKIGLSRPRVGRMVDINSTGRVHLRWSWPNPRFSETCFVGFCRHVPTAAVDPKSASVHLISIDRRRWENGGGYFSIIPKPVWGRCIVVWAEINFGFDSLFSHPLLLGRIPI